MGVARISQAACGWGPWGVAGIQGCRGERVAPALSCQGVSGVDWRCLALAQGSVGGGLPTALEEPPHPHPLAVESQAPLRFPQPSPAARAGHCRPVPFRKAFLKLEAWVGLVPRPPSRLVVTPGVSACTRVPLLVWAEATWGLLAFAAGWSPGHKSQPV